jgi:hypothetical protein
MVRRLGPSKYAPLAAYLAALHADAVTLTIPEIEAIVGAPLPPSARQRSFWGNSRRGTFDIRPWAQVGWWVVRAEVRLAPPAITFVRVAPDSTR